MTKYNWLDKDITFHKEDEKTLDIIDQKKWTNLKKNAMAQYYLKTEHVSSIMQSWSKTEEYKKIEADIISNTKTQYTLSGIMIIMMGTIFIYFLASIVTQNFLVAFWLDGLVASIGLVLLIRNLLLKYRLIQKYTEINRFLFMDIASFIVCIFIKFTNPTGMDFTLIVLVVVYFLTKRMFNEMVDKTASN